MVLSMVRKTHFNGIETALLMVREKHFNGIEIEKRKGAFARGLSEGNIQASEYAIFAWAFAEARQA